MKVRTSKRIGWGVVGFLFGVVLAGLGIASSGGGHSNITLILAIAPYGLGLLLWPILGATVSDPGSLWSRRVFLGAIAIHYGGFLMYISQNWESEVHWLAVAVRHEYFVALSVLAIALYVLGQSFLWFRFLKTGRQPSTSLE